MTTSPNEKSAASDGLPTALRADMPVTERCIYLQTGTKGPMSRAVWKTLCDAELLAAREGPAAHSGRQPLLDASEAARGALGRLLNVPTQELCWSLNTSTAMRTVLRSLEPTSDDVLITSDIEHVATRSLCDGLRESQNLSVKMIETAGTDEDFLLRLEETCRSAHSKRKILLLSHVSCIDGRRLPVAQAVKIVRATDGISLIDGAQAVGQLPVDLQTINSDFYVASGHKWLLGPAGVGYIHVREDQLATFNPNWLPKADRENATAARLGETGSVDFAPRAALYTAIENLLEFGIENVASQIAALAVHLRAGLRTLPPVSLLGPDDPFRTTGLIGFTVAGHSADDLQLLVAQLYEEHKIVIKFQPEKTALRVSLAAFNTADDVDSLLRTLTEKI